MNVTRNLTVNVTRNAATAFTAMVVLVSMITFGSSNDRPLFADRLLAQDVAGNGSGDGPAGGPALPSVSAAATVLEDFFDRADSAVVGPTVGPGWVEVEQAGSTVSVAGFNATSNGKLFFETTSDGVNRPLVKRNFTSAVSTGTVQWDLDFDWARTGNEGIYRFLMQLGNSAAMNDNSQDAGTGVNLVWTRINGVDQRLGYRQGTTDTFLTGVSGPAHIRVVANLNSTPKTYSVAVNSLVIQSNIPFYANVASLDTVRFLTDNLNHANFDGRTIDNLVVFSSDATPPGGNTPPVAQAQSVTTNANTPLTVTLNATDAQQCQLVFSIVTGPAHGTLSPLPPSPQPCVAGSPNSDTATVVYTPNAGYTGPDSFTWRANDGQVFSSNASVNITVAGGSQTVLFSDNFNRAASTVVGVPSGGGAPWFEGENAGAGATVSIGNFPTPADGKLFFDDTSDVENRPLVRRSFTPVSTGTLQWDFDSDWARTGNEGTYRFLMQLGSSAAMNDNSQDAGAGINLVWTSIGGAHQTLGYRKTGVDTDLSVVSGAAKISVVANLATKMYSVAVNGSTVGAGIPFDANVTSLNTVRFLTDNLNDANISGRTIDNVSVSTSSSPPGNVPPVAHNQSAGTTMNQPVALQLSYTDTDGPGPFSFTIVTQPSNGVLFPAGPNGPDRTYTPNNNFTGSDSFTWRVNDGLANSNTATMALTVSAPGGPQNLQPTPAQTNVSTSPTLEIGCSPANTTAAQYQIATNSNFSPVVYNSGETINDICSHLALAGLNPNTSYFWRGRIRTGQTWSPYSQPTSFTTVSATPVNNVFLDGQNGYNGTSDADIRGSAVNPTEFIRNWNQGAQDVIRTGRRLPNQATDEIFRTLLQFDIPSGLDPTKVVNAYIELTGWHHTDSNHLFHAYNSMYKLNKPWGEGNNIVPNGVPQEFVDDNEVSWQYTAKPNQWTIWGAASASDTNSTADRSATPLVHRVSTNQEGLKSYWSSKILVDAVKGWISNPASNYGVFIKAVDESSQQTLHQASKENPDINFRPKLVIVTTDQAPPNAPVAQGQSVTTNANTAVTVTLTATDAQQCQLVFSIVTGPAHGSLGALTNQACVAGSPNSDSATVVYTPNAGYTGPDSFTWRASDGQVFSGATVSIDVFPAGLLLSDNFNRANSATVGNGWTEAEETGATVSIFNNELFFGETSDAVNRPLVKRTFPQVTTGTLQWDFDLNWTRIGNEGTYRLLMQLGSGMSDASQNGGAGVNLVWTSINGAHESLAFRQGNVDTLLTKVSGPGQRIRVVANLTTKTYSVAVNGQVIQSNIAFDSNVSLNTVRFFTDALHHQNFPGRSFDNVTINIP